jgi:O-antigen/teichoic acid export membrane protein
MASPAAVGTMSASCQPPANGTVSVHGIVFSMAASARAVRALGWASVDHGVSSLSNVLVSLAVARGTGLEGMGQFAVAAAVFYVVVGLQRALVSEPLLVSRRTCEPGGDEERGALGCCVAMGLAGAAVTMTVGAALGHSALMALAWWLPLMALQDGIRFVAFRRLQPRTAALVDLTWAVASAAAWPLVRSGSPARAVSLWAAGAAVSAVAGLALLHLRPAGASKSLAWWKSDGGRLAVAFGAEAALASLAAQAGLLVVAGVLGSQALGVLRAAQIVVAPAILLLSAFGAFALPRLARRGHALGRADTIRASAAAALLISPVVTLAAAKSDAIGRTLFGPGTAINRSILAGLLVGTVVAAAAQGVVLYLKVTRQGRVLLGARVVAATTLVCLIVLVASSGRSDWLGWAFAAQSTAYLGAALVVLNVARHPSTRPLPGPAIT